MVLESAETVGSGGHSDFVIRCGEGGMLMRSYLGQQITFLLIN